MWDPWGISRTSTPVHLHPTDSLPQGWAGKEAAGSRVEEVVVARWCLPAVMSCKGFNVLYSIWWSPCWDLRAYES